MTEKRDVYDVQPLRSREEIDGMKQALRRWCGERALFMFVFGINTGLRVSDIVALRVADVKDKTHARIVEQKSGKVRTINLKAIQPEINAYITGMSPDGWLFPSRKGDGHITPTQAYRDLVKAGAMIDRTDIGTHTMRKTFGYHHYKRNKDVAALQEIFNHSAPSITKRYIGIRQDEIDESLDGFKL